jgi:hypothetical protein
LSTALDHEFNFDLEKLEFIKPLRRKKIMNISILVPLGMSSYLKDIFAIGRIAILALLMTGCSHDFMLNKPDGTLIGPGSIEYSQNNSIGTVTLSINGIAYRGSWEAHKVDESGYIATKYGVASRKFSEYTHGNGNYLRNGQATLHSDQGTVLKCNISYRGAVGHGQCESGSDKFEVVLTQVTQA